MYDALNHQLTVMKNCATSNSAQTCVTARCDVNSFLMHTERMAA